MAQLGKFLKDKHFKQIELFLDHSLVEGEKIIGMFKTTNGKPKNELLLLTDQRIVTLAKLTKNNSIVEEFAADDVLRLDAQEKFGMARKTYIVHKNGNRAYVGLVNGEDAAIATRLLSTMSGSPEPLRSTLRSTDVNNAKSDKSTYIVLVIVGLVVLVAIPPLFVPFIIGAFVGMLIRKKK